MGKSLTLAWLSSLKRHAVEYDIIIVHGYSFVASILAVAWMKRHGVEYGIEADGAIIPDSENAIKTFTKRYCIENAKFCLSSGKATSDFFVHYGAKREKCYIYPFSSISSKDIAQAKRFSQQEKIMIRSKLGIEEDKIILTVGRFSYNNGYGKGYDLLMKVAERINDNIGIYFVGDNPTQEFLGWKESKIFQMFISSALEIKMSCINIMLAQIYLYCFHGGDVWGLSINEAMMFGLPVITTTKCLAGLELIQNGVNGKVINVEDENDIFYSINELIHDDDRLFVYGENSIKKNCLIYVRIVF